MSPQQQRQQTQDALVAWLLEEATRQPVLAVWEDLHWADPTTLELLGLLVEQIPDRRHAARAHVPPGVFPPWPTRSHLTPITLNRLERPQVEALIAHLAGGKALPAEVVAHIVAKTDGVPLYVEELTKMLLASDLLRARSRALCADRPAVHHGDSETLQDSLMARLDQLTTAKEVAQLGAVLGREFALRHARGRLVSGRGHGAGTGWPGWWRPNCSTSGDGRRGPDICSSMRSSRMPPMHSLLRSTRQQVPSAGGRSSWRHASPRSSRPSRSWSAQHYTAAGCTEQAVLYWQRAGQQASDRSAYLEAISHLHHRDRAAQDPARDA